jgi:hypothetical protein
MGVCTKLVDGKVARDAHTHTKACTFLETRMGS